MEVVDLGYKDYEETIWKIYEEEMLSRKSSDYVECEEQMEKVKSAYSFFKSIDGCRMEPLKPNPIKENVGITAYFTVFYLYGDQIAEFQKIVGDMSALSIDALSDGTVCISFNIPNVFVRKGNNEQEK